MQAQTKGGFTKVTILLAQRYHCGSSYIGKIDVVKYLYEYLTEEYEIRMTALLVQYLYCWDIFRAICKFIRLKEYLVSTRQLAAHLYNWL